MCCLKYLLSEKKIHRAVTFDHIHISFWITALLNTLVIRSSLKHWQSMKKECIHARHTCYSVQKVKGKGLGHQINIFWQTIELISTFCTYAMIFKCLASLFQRNINVNYTFSFENTNFCNSRSCYKNCGNLLFWLSISLMYIHGRLPEQFSGSYRRLSEKLLESEAANGKP